MQVESSLQIYTLFPYFHFNIILQYTSSYPLSPFLLTSYN
jgi:hypothetical protein